jgi:low temperature requirement protein LtrA
VIIALGESIVAIGIGAAGTLDFAMGAVAVFGIGLAAALWWMYFDVVALISAKRLSEAAPGKEQNELARDSYSFIHVLLIAGIVLVAFGMKSTIAHAEEHLHDVEATALLGGVALYLIGLVAFRWRHVRTLNRERLGLAIVLLILIPVAVQVAAWLALLGVVVLVWVTIAAENRSYGELRDEIRKENTIVHGN